MHRNSAALRKRACTHTDGGMLWCVPPTLASLTLKVEKSKSRHAHHAPETSPLLHTCIFSRNILLPCEFCGFMLPPRILPPRIPRHEKIYFLLMGKSTVSHADSSNDSLQCARLLRDAEDSAGRAGRILRCASYPKCCGVAPQNGARSFTPRLLRQVKSAQTLGCDRAECARCAEWRSGGGGPGENIKRCSALESTPTPPE